MERMLETIDQALGVFPGDPGGDAAQRLEAYLESFRSRSAPVNLFSQETVALIRERATEANREAAAERLQAILESDFAMCRFDPIFKVKLEDLALAGRSEWFEATAARVAEREIIWPPSPWGLVHALMDYLLKAIVVPECRAEHLVPFLHWLVDYLPKEWAWSRTWDETLLGDSGHNWWLHTFLGYYMAGQYLPEFEGFAQFQSFMPDYFEHEMAMLMERDGFSKEKSGYHYGTVTGHWVLTTRLMEVAGVEPSATFVAHRRACMDTIWKMIAPYGTVQLTGDTNATFGPMRSVGALRTVAALFDIPEAKFVAEALEPNWKPAIDGVFLVQGRNCWEDYRRLEARAPAGTPDTVLPDSGYTFMRSAWGGNASAVCIEGGPTGNTIHSHNHNNLHHLELHSHGRPILMDNGPGGYGGSPERMWRVSSEAHNVVTVDGEEQIPLKSEWRWEYPVLPTRNAWRSEDGWAFTSGSHEGYSR
ncbi:MAG: heparinase II/III domain-containing protein, partial [Planctomycetota bacterium]